MTEDNNQVVLEEKTPSRGQLFKKAHGFSLTMAKNIASYNVSSVEEYKQLRKARKKQALKDKRTKHSKALAGRGSGKKTKFEKTSKVDVGRKRK